MNEENATSIVSEPGEVYTAILQERMLDFAVKTFEFLKTMPYRREYDVFRNQLSKSSTSIGANYEEALF